MPIASSTTSSIGRPKGSASESDYRAVLKGHGYGRGHVAHRNGWFIIDNDAARALDPARAQGSGTAKVTHELHQWPATIAVALRPSDNPTWTDITVTHQSDGAGSVDIGALGDIDAIKDGKLENVVLHSRWATSGAGRADVQLSGGTLTSLVKASECWSSSFFRSYYVDSVNYKPTEGDAAACVFTEASF